MRNTHLLQGHSVSLKDSNGNSLYKNGLEFLEAIKGNRTEYPDALDIL